MYINIHSFILLIIHFELRISYLIQGEIKQTNLLTRALKTNDPEYILTFTEQGCSSYDSLFTETQLTTNSFNMTETTRFIYSESLDEFIAFGGISSTLFNHFDISCGLIYSSHPNYDLAYNHSIFISGFFLESNSNIFLTIWPGEGKKINFSYYNIRTQIINSNSITLSKQLPRSVSVVCKEFVTYQILCAFVFDFTKYEFFLYDISNYQNNYGNYQYSTLSQNTLDISSINNSIYDSYLFKLKDRFFLFCFTEITAASTYCSFIQGNSLKISQPELFLSPCGREMGFFFINENEMFIYCIVARALSFPFMKIYLDLDFHNSYEHNMMKLLFISKRSYYLSSIYFSNSNFLFFVSGGNFLTYVKTAIPICKEVTYFIGINEKKQFTISIDNPSPQDTYKIDFIQKPEYGIVTLQGSDEELILFSYYDDLDTIFEYTPPGAFLTNKITVKYLVYNSDDFSSEICSLFFMTCYSSCGSCNEVGDSTSHKCTSCSDKYHFIADEPNSCIKETDKPDNYYLNEDTNTYEKCYESCGSCSKLGNSTDNKCTSCKENYIVHPGKNNLCVQPCSSDEKWLVSYLTNDYICTGTCPDEYIYYNPSTKQCIIDCSLINKVYYNFECISDCPEKTFNYKSECIDECPSFLSPNIEAQQCENCKDKNKYLYQGECIDDKPENTFIEDKSYNVLKNCFYIIDEYKLGTYYQQKEGCNSQCPLEYYYYNTALGLCAKCYQTCKKCDRIGNSDKHGCVECIEDFIKFEKIPNKCLKPCDDLWSYDENYQTLQCIEKCEKMIVIDTNECTTKCDSNYLIFEDKYCVLKCPNGYQVYKGFCYDNSDSVLEMEKNISDIMDMINGNLSNVIDNINDISPSVLEKDNSTLQIYTTDKKDEANQQSIEKNISIIDFSECEDKIRKYYKMKDSDRITILKYDINTQDSKKKTFLQAFDESGKEINITQICDNVTISISTPVDLSEYDFLDPSNPVDIFNSSDPFFNVLCHPFSNDGGKDITLSDRRSEIYEKPEFCSEGCTYTGMDYTNNMAKCDCSPKKFDIGNALNSIDADANEVLIESFSKIASGAIQILKCYNLVFSFSYIKRNIGFWLFLIITLFEFVVGSLGVLLKYDKLYAFLHKYANDNEVPPDSKSSPPGKLTILDDFNSDDEDISVSSQVVKKYDSSDMLYRTPNKTHQYYHSNNYLGTNHNFHSYETQFTSNQKKVSTGYRTPSKTQREINDVCYSRHKTYGTHDDLYEDEKYKNDIIISKFKPTPLSKMDTDYQIDTYYNSNKKTNKIKISKKTDNGSSKIEEDVIVPTTTKMSKETNENIINNNNSNANSPIEEDNLDELEFEEAMINDKRGLFTIYWSFLSNKQIILSICLNKNPFSPTLIKLFLSVFTISLFFVFNAVLFKDELISNRYHSKENSNISYILQNELSKCVYASFITSAMNFIISFIFSHYHLSKVIKEKGNKGKDYLIEIKKGIRQSKIKFGICLLILFIILLFFWYYVSAFCSVYPNSQLAWVESSLITLAFNNLLSFLFLFLSSVLRFLSNKFKSLVLFKLSGILSDFS